MPTQKTGIGGGKLPPKNEETKEKVEETNNNIDLGIPDNVVIDDDPTGWVPDVPVDEIAGRKVRQITPEHLEEAHRRYAGSGVRITGETTSLPSSENPDSHQPVDDSPLGTPTSSTVSEAARLMPDAYKNTPQQGTTKQGPVSQPLREKETIDTEEPYEYETPDVLRIGKDEAKSAAMTFEYLSGAEKQAREQGDFGAAAQARNMINKLQDDYKFRQNSEAKMEHPALTKLLTNLGLKKIKQTPIEWGGSKWTFAATNAELDYWVTKNMDEEGMNIIALSISAGLVGLDDVPLYEVLNVPLTKNFEVASLDATDEDNEQKQEVTLDLYQKYCTCGNQITVSSEECPICGASQDVFDIPLHLRMVCAQRFNQLLSEKFGAYEALPQLQRLRRDAMKDRRLDARELFPLVIPSSEEKTTQD